MDVTISAVLVGTHESISTPCSKSLRVSAGDWGLSFSTNDGLVGITGTPIIDPATDTVYFYAKSYPGADRGVYNGAYWIYALDINNLK